MEDLRKQVLQFILDQEGTDLSEDQSQALGLFLDFIRAQDEQSTFLLTGSAGTGKTFLINILTAYLRKSGFKVVLLAPTGRAAKVITKRTQRLAYTIHHHIYTPDDNAYGGMMFELKRNREQANVVYVVDEASMIGDGREEGSRSGLLPDLLRFVFDHEGDSQRKLILVGDPVQLPPIGNDASPALDPEVLEGRFHLHVWHAHLSEVKRQMEDSGILGNAVLIRDAYLFPTEDKLVLQPRRDFLALENGYEAIENYLGYYRDGEPDRVILLCYSNSRAAKINQGIRHQLLFTQEPLIEGDLLMVVKNNYAWGDPKRLPFIANGEMGVVRYLHEDTRETKYGLKWIDVDIEFEDAEGETMLLTCKVVLDLLDSKLPQLPEEVVRRIQGERRVEYAEMPKGQAAELTRKDPYINALQVKYGYAITGHKAQGGQWQNVIISFEPDYGNNPINYLRWTYTVVTRAEERLMLLDCPFWEE